jgi:hypothetical protein
MAETVGQESFMEPVTRVKFSASFTPFGSSNPLRFVGAGVREKKVAFINVKVYAVALYVEPGVKAALASWRGHSASSLASNNAFFNSVLTAPVQKALQIVLVRDITGAQFWGALSESLQPRLRAARAGEAWDQALTELGKVFQTRPLTNGMSITLNWIQPSTLQVAVAPTSSAKATIEASIDNKALVSSIFDIYVGDQPISPGAKLQFAAGLARFM